MTSYSWSYKLLHWLLAVFILIMFFALQGFNPAMSDAERMQMLMGHSSIGTMISLLVLIRITKRFVLKHQRPSHPLPKWQARTAKLTHYALYALMLVVPITGYLSANVHSFDVLLFGHFPLNGHANEQTFTFIRQIHAISVKALLALVLVHIAAALMHKLVRKDKVLSSMRPWFSKKVR